MVGSKNPYFIYLIFGPSPIGEGKAEFLEMPFIYSNHFHFIAKFEVRGSRDGVAKTSPSNHF